jgi:hypothetical protein
MTTRHYNLHRQRSRNLANLRLLWWTEATVLPQVDSVRPMPRKLRTYLRARTLDELERELRHLEQSECAMDGMRLAANEGCIRTRHALWFYLN